MNWTKKQQCQFCNLFTFFLGYTTHLTTLNWATIDDTSEITMFQLTPHLVVGYSGTISLKLQLETQVLLVVERRGCNSRNLMKLRCRNHWGKRVYSEWIYSSGDDELIQYCSDCSSGSSTCSDIIYVEAVRHCHRTALIPATYWRDLLLAWLPTYLPASTYWYRYLRHSTIVECVSRSMIGSKYDQGKNLSILKENNQRQCQRGIFAIVRFDRHALQICEAEKWSEEVQQDITTKVKIRNIFSLSQCHQGNAGIIFNISYNKQQLLRKFISLPRAPNHYRAMTLSS